MGRKISHVLLSISFIFLSIPIFVIAQFLYRNIVDQTLLGSPVIDFVGSPESIATFLISILVIGVLFFAAGMYVRRHA